ncbi:MAG: excinuclease ABC subunit C [Deltaproteobacteria bacterium]|nr:MAG: excinuclease ABC subunit C [Deltaproteobacteria bacterium]
MALTHNMIESLPRITGVYIMKDSTGRPIYVGKAKDIRSRVRAYLGQDTRPFVRFIQENTSRLDFIATSNEKEALLLEDRLIKTYKPKYNIFLKDDKTYVRFKVTVKDQWPGIYITRRVLKDGSLYLGPYSSANATRETLSAIGRIFPVRRCKDSEFRNRSRPCIYYQIGLCLAPCVGKVTQKEYAQVVDDMILFLRGKDKALLRQLEERMQKEAKEQNFERAAKIRDQIAAIKDTLVPQMVIGTYKSDVDVIGTFSTRQRIDISLLHISGGSIVDTDTFVIDTNGHDLKDVVLRFMVRFYQDKKSIPNTIYTQVIPGDKETLESILSDKKGSQVRIARPSRGRPKAWLEMAQANASNHGLAKEEKLSALEDIAKTLHLPHIPYRMECYDISSIQGAYAVGSRVVFMDSQERKDMYRHYRIKGVPSQDDFAMMEEILRRRFLGDDSRPDLIVIDGGKGQLNVCVRVLKDLGIKNIPVVAMAKKRGGKTDRFFLPGRKNPVMMPRDSEGLKILQRLRDEAHRFAITYHRRLRLRSLKRSTLEEIKGIGPVKASIILKQLGGKHELGRVMPEDLSPCKGLSRKDIERVIAYLRDVHSKQDKQ